MAEPLDLDQFRGTRARPRGPSLKISTEPQVPPLRNNDSRTGCGVPQNIRRAVEPARLMLGELLSKSLSQRNDDIVSFGLADLLSDLSLDRQLVSTVT